MVSVDVNLSLGRWPFRPSPLEGREALAEYLRRHGVIGGLVRSSEAPFSRVPDLENERLLARCRGWKGFLPLPVVHPDWAYWKALQGVSAAALYPSFQGYGLAEGGAVDMGRGLVRHGILPVVVMREEDERAQHPLCRVPRIPLDALETFAEALAPSPVLVLNAYLGEILACHAGNLHFDLGFAEGFPTLPLLREKVAAERLLLGSHAPHFCVSSAIAKLEKASSAEIAAISFGNAARLLGLPVGG
ncbi:MAG: hypothetical protein IJJ33_17170 [Victivallales bacterium]|nr:hypothetical protein [Victivallales bacterium]